MRDQDIVAGGRRWPGTAGLLLAGVLALATLVSSCSDDPAVAGWEAAWQETRQSLPSLEAVMAGEPGETCSATLGMLRQASEELLAAPNPDLAGAFLDWSKFAESVFFECPPTGGEYPGFEASYEEIARLASEVDALLDFEHDLLDGQ